MNKLICHLSHHFFCYFINLFRDFFQNLVRSILNYFFKQDHLFIDSKLQTVVVWNQACYLLPY